MLLAERLEVRPEEVRFTYSEAGKPRLEPDAGGRAIRFNLSHSQDLLAIALTEAPDSDVGVDVEWTGRVRAFQSLVARFGTPKERAAFAALPERERCGAFYRWWTRKEAVVKGAGVTLAKALGNLELPFDSMPVCEPGLPDSIFSRSEREGRWRVYTWELAGGYIASLAVRKAPGGEDVLRCQGARHPELPLRLAATLTPWDPFHETAAEE